MSKEQKEKERKARGDEIRSAQMTFLRLLVCNLVEGSRLRRRSWNSSLSNCRRFAVCSGSCCPSSLCCSQFRPCSKRNRLRCSYRGRCIRLVQHAVISNYHRSSDVHFANCLRARPKLHRAGYRGLTRKRGIFWNGRLEIREDKLVCFEKVFGLSCVLPPAGDSLSFDLSSL